MRLFFGFGMMLVLCLFTGKLSLPQDSKEGNPTSEKDTVVEIRSTQSGRWSDAKTWERGKLPGAGMRVRVRSGHRVIYDLKSEVVFRSVLIGGTLAFPADQDTILNTGLINVQPGDSAGETGFDCADHLPAIKPGEPRALLEVGTAERPIEAGHSATIRLHYVEGTDKASFPAIVCCGGARMEFHGTPMSRTWVKLGQPAKAGDEDVTLDEAVTGWRPGDRVIVVSTQLSPFEALRHLQDYSQTSTETEERIVKAVNGAKLTLDKPLAYDHMADRRYRGEVANLSRNVVVESAAPEVARGHTMFHRDSAGSIGYAEFRHLGKEGILGRYSIHFHLCGDTMRGASVIGASIWDSGNRWITIHGTNYLVVRDCVGYRSQGHGFFLEDGTEAYNVLDHNLAVRAFTSNPQPKQVLPFDENDGAGFWWANCLNAFTRNVAAECAEYGYFFQVQANSADFDPVLAVQQPDGERKRVDVRTLPFVRFEDNEAHTQRRWGINMGSTPFHRPARTGVAPRSVIGPDTSVGPDVRHPFVIQNMLLWNNVWSFGVGSSSVLVDGVDIYNFHYGFYNPLYKDTCYRRITYEKNVNPGKVEARLNQGGKGKRADEASYPKPLDPVDDRPPVTVMTFAARRADGSVVARGTTADDGVVTKVVVNGREAKSTRGSFAEWEVVLAGIGKGELKLRAHAEDAAGNVETYAHELVYP